MKSPDFFSQKLNEGGDLNHLEKGVQPIRACIMNLPSLQKPEDKIILQRIKTDAEFVDWHGREDFFGTSNAREKGKPGEWVISPISENNKYSDDYWNCTGIFAVGTDKKDGKQLSLLSHQNPGEFLTNKNKFSKDLSESLARLKESCKSATIDLVIFGGNQAHQEHYKDSISLIGEICKEVLDFSPEVVTGPDFTNEGPASVYAETKSRRIYLIRPEQKFNELNQNFNTNDIDDAMDPWLKWRGLIK